MPFITLFLSARTTKIQIVFLEPHLHCTTAASMIAALPTLCPNFNWIRLIGLPRNPITTAAISGLVLTTKNRPLRYFVVDSLLTEEACRVLFRNPDLCALQAFIDGSATLPTMALPSITDICIKYDRGHEWLQGFRGGSLGKLTSVAISSDCDTIDDFLGAFKTVAVTSSLPVTLTTFKFKTTRAWRPSYRSLLPFTQLKVIDIDFSCGLGCSSTIDDDTITDLARAMPRLEMLYLGDTPCETPGRVTVKGLAALSCYCPNLAHLCIHFRVASLDPLGIPNHASAVLWQGCPLKHLLPGATHVPEMFVPMVSLALLRIFPHLIGIESDDTGWKNVLKAFGHFKKHIAQVRHTHLLCLGVSLMIPPSTGRVISDHKSQ